MRSPENVKDILIVGGGTAGWLTATILASRLNNKPDQNINIKLIEAPGIPIIGVGEGTWPSMRQTLYNAGIREADFLKFCSASFKQASKFIGWRTGRDDDFYYHPFDLPESFGEENAATYWLSSETEESFSNFCCVQESICEQHLSPKLKTTREYSGATNYGYHLDAGRFSLFLREHCTEKMGVDLILDRVTSINASTDGNITSVETESSVALAADLFIDCTGFRSLLLGEHLGVEFIDKSDVFPINSAIAVRLPYGPEAPVKSPTISTAQEAGWIWDIGLSHRRGVGHVYSDKYISHEKAQQQLQDYLGIDDAAMAALSPKSLAIRPGYREEVWRKNCIAIGLSAGFLEPLEATAMMLIESSANMVAEVLTSSQESFEDIAQKFNSRSLYRWERIIDFLKLHYVLSERPEPFWVEAASHENMSKRLKDDILLWQTKYEVPNDFSNEDDMFPAASYQYVLYGMGGRSKVSESSESLIANEQSEDTRDSIKKKEQLLSAKLMSNRDMLDLIAR